LNESSGFRTLEPDGAVCIKVLDFGIAKWAQSGTEKLEASGVMGSAPYMAPEQIASPQQVDARTDVWALGATLFQLLTGKTPFQHEGVTTVHAMIVAVLQSPPLRPRSLNPELPLELEAVLLRCLEKEPAARFQSMAALSDALAPFRSGQTLPASAPLATTVRATPPVQWSTRVLGAGALLFGLMLGGAVFGWRHLAPAASEPSAEHAVTAPASAFEPAQAADRPDLQRAPPPVSDHVASASPDASTTVRTIEQPAKPPSPRAPQPSRGVSPPLAASAPPATTRPKELYGERR
jgi:serine/threonine-protein kinase